MAQLYRQASKKSIDNHRSGGYRIDRQTSICCKEPSRVAFQLALNVDDLDESIAFYTELFQTPPAKVREDYANFAIADPPLKLVLFANSGEPGTLNHIGVEVGSSEEVAAVIARTRGMDQQVQENVTCCFAVQDKTWVKGPENDWEFYTVLADAPSLSCSTDDPCCPAEA